MESSRRGLLNDIAEHRPIIFKNNQNTYHPRFWLHIQNRYSTPPNRGFLCVFSSQGKTQFFVYLSAVAIVRLPRVSFILNT